MNIKSERKTSIKEIQILFEINSNVPIGSYYSYFENEEHTQTHHLVWIQKTSNICDFTLCRGRFW